jgi:hypothetical protein
MALFYKQFQCKLFLTMLLTAILAYCVHTSLLIYPATTSTLNESAKRFLFVCLFCFYKLCDFFKIDLHAANSAHRLLITILFQRACYGRFRSNEPDSDGPRTVHEQAPDSRRTGLFLTDHAQASLCQCLVIHTHLLLYRQPKSWITSKYNLDNKLYNDLSLKTKRLKIWGRLNTR